MTPVCDGAGSHFAIEQSLVIYVLWPSALATLCNKLGQNSVYFRCVTATGSTA